MAQTKPEPVGDRVTILPDKPMERTKSGIYIPDAAQEKTNVGKVVVVNSETKQVKPGDRVVYGKHSGTEVIYKDKSYWVMRESDIVAII